MPQAKVCLCKSYGCVDEVRPSRITGQILKGRYLTDTEYRSHQREETSLRLSGRRDPLPQQQVMPSDSSQSPPSAAPSFPPQTFHHTSLIVDAAPMAQQGPLQPCCDSPLLTQPQGEDQDGLDLVQPSADGHARHSAVANQSLAQGRDEGNPSTETPTSQRGVTQEGRIMRSIENCRLDFHSWQRNNISSDELVFEETPALHPPPRLPLRVDMLANTKFIEYEELMFNLLDRIEKIKTQDYEHCDIAKRNIFSSVEDELHRLRGLKEYAWKRQAASASSLFPAPRSGPFREIETCE